MNPPASKVDKTTGAKSRSLLSMARAAVGSALLGGVALLAAGSYVSPALRICRDRVDGGAVLQACGPVGAEDLPTIGLVLLIALLLLPGWSEVTLPGLGTIKRQIASLERSIGELRVQQSATLTNQLIIADPGRVREQALPELRSFPGAAPPKSLTPRSVSPERADSEAQLVRLTGQLETYVRMATRQALGMNLDVYLQLQEWLRQFNDAIDVVRATRNTVALKPEDLTDDQVSEAVQLASDLVAAATKAVTDAMALRAALRPWESLDPR